MLIMFDVVSSFFFAAMNKNHFSWLMNNDISVHSGRERKTLHVLSVFCKFFLLLLPLAFTFEDWLLRMNMAAYLLVPVNHMFILNWFQWKIFRYSTVNASKSQVIISRPLPIQVNGYLIIQFIDWCFALVVVDLKFEYWHHEGNIDKWWNKSHKTCWWM